jgi:hypothetical protein
MTFDSQQVTCQEADFLFILILLNKDENLSVAPAAVNTVVMKLCK